MQTKSYNIGIIHFLVSLFPSDPRYPEEQTSIAVRLHGGKAYYFQIVCGQELDKSSCSVGMQMPNGKMSRPIRAKYLSRTTLGMFYSKKPRLNRKSSTADTFL